MTIHLPHRVSSGPRLPGATGPAGPHTAPPARSAEFCGHTPPCTLAGFAACGLDGDPQNARQARRFVSDTLDEWSLPGIAGDMHLLVTELVTNAVCHALGPGGGDGSDYPVWLGLFRHPRHVVCAVADPSPEPPRPRAAGASSPGGRGLALIGALCDGWSWCPTAPRGKTVWATLPLPATAA